MVDAAKYEKHKQDLKLAAEQRKLEWLRKSKIKANQIRSRDESKWSVSDYRALLTYKKQAGDPPSSKITDKNVLRSMWLQRQSRSSPTYMPLDNDDYDEDNKLSVNNLAQAPDPLLEMPFIATTDDDGQATSEFI